MMKVRWVLATILITGTNVPALGFGLLAAQSISSEQQLVDDFQSEGENRDQLTFSPYLWGPDVGGTVSLGPVSAPVDLSLTQLASGIKIAGMGHVQYETGPVFLYAEGIGAKFGDPEFSSFANQPVSASALLLETGAGFIENVKLTDNFHINISPYAGVRYVHLEAEVSGPVIAVAGKNEWVDPVVGAIGAVQLNDRWGIIGKVDFAGLSLTDNSYRNLAIGLQYQASNRLALVAGYRSTKGSFTADHGLSADLSANGPMIGLRYSLRN
ncbi:hypothetical protein [Parasphingorhabdus sp.]|uniref:hypothetical protein n=1 Tax=Parasphingorhabdus sp. TaxID=2709688 RepID=UPI003BAE4E0B